MILFDGSAKTITLTAPGAVSLRALWTAYLLWLAQPGNRKFALMLSSVGMNTSDIPLYLFLEDGVTIVVADNSTPTVVFDGVLKTRNGRDPFGGAIVNVRYEAPGIAIGYSTTAAAGATATETAAAVWSHPFVAKLLTVAKFLGLK